MRPHKEVKLKDIADELGISVVSVSNAIRGKSGVSEALRRRVLECAERRGIDADTYAGRKTIEKNEVQPEDRIVSIAVIVSKRYISVDISFYWEMYQKTAYAASRRGCVTMLEMPDDDAESMAPRLLRRGGIDGVIIIGPMREAYLRKILEAAECPVVFMDQQIEDGRYSSVLSGNYYGMYRSVRELVRAGHKKIGFVGALDESRNIIDRYYGYKKCMRENGLNVRREWILSDRSNREEIPGIILPDELPTAFACSSDYAAAILYDALRERGYRVPEDISIAGYDDYLIGHELSGHLTTYHVDMAGMAKCAINLVLREIRDPSSAGVICEVDSNMVFRDSIAEMI
ncbi:MAG: LacI family DNA-binding transcriptional regulator [Lachnospiraceae bacterium]|nr:LacI family DNA-binding transcriptional regulator [Lachnospiraceae bacterium]